MLHAYLCRVAWWSDSLQKWRMTYGTTEGANVYESADFTTWTHVGLLNQVDTSGQWECPDFFPVPGAAATFLLKASTNGKDYWATGLYDEASCSFTPKSGAIPSGGQLYDFGAYYAR